MIHEIGFLIALSSCNQPPMKAHASPNEATAIIRTIGCPEKDDFGSVQLDSSTSEQGLPVYEKKAGNWFKLKDKAGTEAWVKASPSSTSVLFVALEQQLETSLIGTDVNVIEELRSEDLKTELKIPTEVLLRIRKERISSWLRAKKVTLPSSYLDVSSPCQSTGQNKGWDSYKCSPPPKVWAYASPNSSSKKIFEASLTYAHLAGQPVFLPFGAPRTSKTERIFGFGIQDGWMKVLINYDPKNRQEAWIQIGALQGTVISKITEEQSLTDFKQRLASGGGEGAPELEDLTTGPLKLGIEQTKRFKWQNGVLWTEVNVKDEVLCQGGPGKKLVKGWLPYVKEKDKIRVIQFYAGGC